MDEQKNLKQIIQEIQNEMQKIKGLDASDIPAIDLYIDQVTTFMEEKLQDYRRNEKDKIITKTMVNNYTKNNVLPVSEKKKYSVEHLLRLILIYHMKPVLSLQDIGNVLNSIQDVPAFYNAVTSLQNLGYDKLCQELLDKEEQVRKTAPNADGKTMLMLLVLLLVLEANRNKIIAEKIIDSYF